MPGLLQPFLPRRISVRISPERVKVRDAIGGRSLEEPPWVALSADAKRRVLAVGTEALAMRGKPGVTVVNPFTHPRTPLSDFIVAEQLLRALVRKVTGNGWWQPGPAIVIGLEREPEGGLTQLEARALKELAIGSGATQAFVWAGPELSEEQLSKLAFPTTGEVLA